MSKEESHGSGGLETTDHDLQDSYPRLDGCLFSGAVLRIRRPPGHAAMCSKEKITTYAANNW